MENASFLEPFLVDSEVLSWNPSSKSSDLAKKTIDVLTVIRDNPILLKDEAVKNMIWDKDSQINYKDKFYFHISKTGEIYQDLVNELLSKFPSLDLPDPKVARVLGLVHDLSKIYAKYDNNFKQHDHELTLYFHSHFLGLDIITNHVAMHSAYFEILEMIKEGSGFKNVDLYKDWTSILNDPRSPLFFDNIKSDFDDFLKGKDNLTLITLTVADHMENKKYNFSLDDFDDDFKSRTSDIIYRYYLNPILDSKEPLALGIGLIKKGGVRKIIIIQKNYYEFVTRKFE